MSWGNKRGYMNARRMVHARRKVSSLKALTTDNASATDSHLLHCYVLDRQKTVACDMKLEVYLYGCTSEGRGLLQLQLRLAFVIHAIKTI